MNRLPRFLQFLHARKVLLAFVALVTVFSQSVSPVLAEDNETYSTITVPESANSALWGLGTPEPNGIYKIAKECVTQVRTSRGLISGSDINIGASSYSDILGDLVSCLTTKAATLTAARPKQFLQEVIIPTLDELRVAPVTDDRNYTPGSLRLADRDILKRFFVGKGSLEFGVSNGLSPFSQSAALYAKLVEYGPGNNDIIGHYLYTLATNYGPTDESDNLLTTQRELAPGLISASKEDSVYGSDGGYANWITAYPLAAYEARVLSKITATGSVTAGNLWVSKFGWHAFDQLKTYIIDAGTMRQNNISIAGWFQFALRSHEPNYSGAPDHSPNLNPTGPTLGLVPEWQQRMMDEFSAAATESLRDGTRGIIRIDLTHSDDGLARLTNACDPGTWNDTIEGAELPVYIACLEWEKEYLNNSGTNRRHKILYGANDDTFFSQVSEAGVPVLKIKRHPDVTRAIETLIAQARSCLSDPAGANLTTGARCSVDSEDQGNAAGSGAGITAAQDHARVIGEPEENPILNAVLGILNLILGLVIHFLLWLTAFIMSFFQSVLSYAGFTTTPFVVTMWKAIRDFVNLFFILALLAIAVANIVQYQINNYAVKTILPKLIVVVIAVNFSRLFVGLVIDAGNVVEAGVYQIAGMGPHGGGTTVACTQNSTARFSIPNDIKQGSVLCRLASGLRFEQLQQYQQYSPGDTAARSTPTLLSLFFINVVIVLIVLMMLFGFLALALTFTIRIVVLWALAITSPIYVISKIAPVGGSVAGEWQSKFFKYAFMHIKTAFFLVLAVLSAENVGSQLFANLQGTSPGVAGGSLIPAGFSSLADYLQVVFVIAMVYAAAFASAKGDYANGIIDKIAAQGSPSTLFGYAKKGLGFGLGVGYGATQMLGNRLQATSGNRLDKRIARGLGWLVASPSNVTDAAKGIYTDFKQQAEDRKKRFGLNRAVQITKLNGFGRNQTSERFAGQLANAENALVKTDKEDMNLRMSVKNINQIRIDAMKSGDRLRARAATEALAESGNLKLDDVVGDNSKNKNGSLRTIREFLLDEERRHSSREQAENLVERLENTNASKINQVYESAKGFVARTGDKNRINERVTSASADGDQTMLTGLLTAINAEGRVKDNATGLEGPGLALARMLQMLRDDGVNKPALALDADARRHFTRFVAKDGIGAYGAQFGDEKTQKEFLDLLLEATAEVDSSLSGYANYNDLQRKANAETFKAATEKMGQLAAAGKLGNKLLRDGPKGNALADRIASMRNSAFGTSITLNGDDGAAGGQVQELDTSSIAAAFEMDINGRFSQAGIGPRKIQDNFMKSLIVNAGRNKSHADRRDAVLANIKPAITTAGQEATMRAFLAELEKNARADEAAAITTHGPGSPQAIAATDNRVKVAAGVADALTKLF
ncbi:hypothetical protein KA517_02055 [Candidatus Gracilibacteria bacterium]|nr:hypothetical protein [Candidatus Gracilibacteria bacterium]